MSWFTDPRSPGNKGPMSEEDLDAQRAFDIYDELAGRIAYVLAPNDEQTLKAVQARMKDALGLNGRRDTNRARPTPHRPAEARAHGRQAKPRKVITFAGGRTFVHNGTSREANQACAEWDAEMRSIRPRGGMTYVNSSAWMTLRHVGKLQSAVMAKTDTRTDEGLERASLCADVLAQALADHPLADKMAGILRAARR